MLIIRCAGFLGDLKHFRKPVRKISRFSCPSAIPSKAKNDESVDLHLHAIGDTIVKHAKPIVVLSKGVW